MKGYLIFTGTELLLGKTLNSNSLKVAELFAELGIDLYKIVTVGDNLERIVGALREVPSDTDIVFLNGGLGPTEDDVTREALLAFLGLEAAPDPGTREKILERTGGRLLPGDLKVAEVPEGAIVFQNETGVAPASVVVRGGTRYFLTPGPPGELDSLLKSGIVPYLKEQLLVRDRIFSRTLKFAGIGESKAEDKIRDLIRGNNPSVAPTIRDGEIHFRITAKGEDEKVLERQVGELSGKVVERLEEYYFGSDEETLESLVAGLLTERKLSLAVAESCTGGLLADSITNIPGSSLFFDRGYITYSNQAKIDDLGVAPTTLEQYGAVSENTALEMAEGVWRRSGADMAVSITGIAGPGGGTIDKPVGMVYMGFRYKGRSTVRMRQFTGDRLTIKRKTVKYILFELLKLLKEG